MNGFKSFMIEKKFTYQELERYLQIPERSLKRYANEGVMPPYNVGNKLVEIAERFLKRQVDRDNFFG